MAQRDERQLLEASLAEESLKRQLSEQKEKFQKKLHDAKHKLMNQLTQKQNALTEMLSQNNHLSDCCEKWEVKVAEIEKEKMKVLQQIQKENNQLQVSCFTFCTTWFRRSKVIDAG